MHFSSPYVQPDASLFFRGMRVCTKNYYYILQSNIYIIIHDYLSEGGECHKIEMIYCKATSTYT